MTLEIDGVIEESENQSQKAKGKPIAGRKFFIKHYKYIDQLISFVSKDSFKDKNNISYFEETSIVTDVNKVGDSFLTFNINDLMAYFTDDAWEAVLSIYTLTVNLSTCPICKKLCLDDCIECSMCLNWFHFACIDLNSKDLVDLVFELSPG